LRLATCGANTQYYLDILKHAVRPEVAKGFTYADPTIAQDERN
jgi:hypothetical protein